MSKYFVLLLLLFFSCQTRNSNNSSLVLNDSVPTQKQDNPVLRDLLLKNKITTACPAGAACLNILAINDVYEIDAVAGGTIGGLARVATLRRILRDYPQSGMQVSMIAGDFLNPSGLARIKDLDGDRWRGRPMLNLLKHPKIAMDFSVLGNHEFDLKPEMFAKRFQATMTPGVEWCQELPDPNAVRDSGKGDKPAEHGTAKPEVSVTEIDPEEPEEPRVKACGVRQFRAGRDNNASCIRWVASNLSSKGKRHLFSPNGTRIPRVIRIGVRNKDFRARVAILGLTINKNIPEGIEVADYHKTAERFVRRVTRSGKFNAIVGLTHLDRAEDVNLMRKLPGIDLTVGGHDHVNSFDCVGDKPRTRCVAKADANARTAYVHKVIMRQGQRAEVRSVLVPLDAATVDPDMEVQAEVDCWFKRAGDLKGKGGLKDVFAELKPGRELDGNEGSVRRPAGSTLTSMFYRSVLGNANDQQRAGATQGAQSKFHFVLMNSGTFRIDDVVGPGPVSNYDILRVLPFGGDLATGKIKVNDLALLLKKAWDLPPGNGGILHTFPPLFPTDQPNSYQKFRTGESIDQSKVAAALAQMAKVGPNDYLNIVSSDFLLNSSYSDLVHRSADGNITADDRKYFSEAPTINVLDMEDQFKIAFRKWVEGA